VLGYKTVTESTGGDLIPTGLVDLGDAMMSNEWYSLSNGSFVGVLFWLVSFLSAIVGASYWDTLEWAKGKLSGNYPKMWLLI
jgi:hypothetical protein